MSEDVKRRRYDGRGRQRQAGQTRARVLAAARHRFLEDGYAPTTVSAVAADAGVSVETVYKGFGNKAGLLKAVFDVAIAGDDEPVPIMARDFVAAIDATPAADRKLRMYADHLADTMPRTAAIQLLVRAAAAGDPEIAGVWDQMQLERLTGMTAFSTHLDESGSLRAGVTRDVARDILWTYNAVELYELLVIHRRWPIDAYCAFVGDALVAALSDGEGA